MPQQTPTPSVTKFNRKLDHTLAAAAEVFAEEGYDHASMRSVAERAGVSVAGLYHYVRSKEELLFLIQFRVFNDLVTRFRDDMRDISSSEARLERLVRNHLERFLANMAELIVCSREIDRLRGEYREQVGALQREYYNLALSTLSELVAGDGAGVSPRMATLALFGSINWIYTWYRPDTGMSAGQMAKDLVQLYLWGVLRAPSHGVQGPETGSTPEGGIDV